MADRYLLTHSLLSSWLYAMRDNPYEDATTERDSYAEFLQVLRREPTPTTDAMRKGFELEDLVTAIANGGGDYFHKWYEAANKIAQIVRGGLFQYRAKKEIIVNDMRILLYGRLDVLKAGEVIDIKYTGSYERGKFTSSTQHPMYLELVPEAEQFTYWISNGSSVWHETYRRDETSDIRDIIKDFLGWLEGNNLMDEYKKYWLAL